MKELGVRAFAVVAATVLVGSIYFLPTIIGWRKWRGNSIFWMNATGIGWIVALVWALKKDDRIPTDQEQRGVRRNLLIGFAALGLLYVGIAASDLHKPAKDNPQPTVLNAEPVNTSPERIAAAKALCEEAATDYLDGGSFRSLGDPHILDGSRDDNGKMRATWATVAEVTDKFEENVTTSRPSVNVTVKVRAQVHNNIAHYWVKCSVLDENGTHLSNPTTVAIGEAFCAHDYGDEICFPVL